MASNPHLVHLAALLSVEAAYTFLVAHRTLTKSEPGSLEEVVFEVSKVFSNCNKSSLSRMISNINESAKNDGLLPILRHSKSDNTWHSSKSTGHFVKMCHEIVDIFSTSADVMIDKSRQNKLEVALNTFSHKIFWDIFDSAFKDVDVNFDINIVDMRSDDMPYELDVHKNIDFAFGERIKFDIDRDQTIVKDYDTIIVSEESFRIMSNFRIDQEIYIKSVQGELGVPFYDLHILPLVIPDQGTILRLLYESKFPNHGHTFTKDRRNNRTLILKDEGVNIKMIVPNVNVMTYSIFYTSGRKKLCSIISDKTEDTLRSYFPDFFDSGKIYTYPISFRSFPYKLFREMYRRKSIADHFRDSPNHPHRIFWDAVSKKYLNSR